MNQTSVNLGLENSLVAYSSQRKQKGTNMKDCLGIGRF